MTIFVGDVHGRFGEYAAILNGIQDGVESIQLGDMGVGFQFEYDCEFPERPGSWFIRGNHDNPEVCSAMPSCLGDFGMHGEIFFLAGGNSPDKLLRTMGIDWWPNEQLSHESFTQAINMYERNKPDVVASHECPSLLNDKLHAWSGLFKSATASVMDLMLSIHRPSLWVFGHHHKSLDTKVRGTRFVCLNELETFEG